MIPQALQLHPLCPFSPRGISGAWLVFKGKGGLSNRKLFQPGLFHHPAAKPLLKFWYINNLNFLKMQTQHQNWQAVQKGYFLTRQPRRAKTLLSTGKAAGHLALGMYIGVREHDKEPRTLLATFFNSLQLDKSRIGSIH